MGQTRNTARHLQEKTELEQRACWVSVMNKMRCNFCGYETVPPSPSLRGQLHWCTYDETSHFLLCFLSWTLKKIHLLSVPHFIECHDLEEIIKYWLVLPPERTLNLPLFQETVLTGIDLPAKATIYKEKKKVILKQSRARKLGATV